MPKLAWSEVVLALLAIVGAFSLKYIKRIAQNMVKNTVSSGLLTRKEHEVYTKINNKLIELLIGMHCDRTYIFLFHNGEDFAGKISRKKVTCTFEHVSQGTSKEIDNLKDLDVTAVWEWVSCFQADQKDLPDGVMVLRNKIMCTHCSIEKHVLHFGISQMRSSHLKALLTTQGIYTMVQTTIRNREGGIMGILGADYCSDIDTTNLPQCDLCYQADIVALHLMELHKVKLTLGQYIKTLLEK